MKRIWLNHWFSTAYCIIELLREDNPDFRIIGSGARDVSPIRLVCDEWHVEPALSGAEYADWCLSFCKRQGVGLFIPRRGAIDIARHKREFENAGTRVMVEDPGLMEELNNKGRAYALFSREHIGIVPDHAVVTNAEDFLAAYRRLSAAHGTVCFKFVTDVGGASYRRIDGASDPLDALHRHQGSRITLEDALRALRSRKSFDPLMLMPYLPDEEVSVDCLMTAHGLVAIPRIKDATRIERIHFDSRILDTCRDLYSKIPLCQPSNIQFKYREGVPYMLEVNTRMSGGVQLSCLATGVNLPSIAANQLLGVDLPWTMDCGDKTVCHIERPLVL